MPTWSRPSGCATTSGPGCVPGTRKPGCCWRARGRRGHCCAGAPVAVAPLRYAVGVQNKVLEAMACATPVVTTSAAVGDLGFNEGGHGFIADDAAAFAERICWLLDDHQLAGQMGRAGRDYVERHHAIGPLAEQLDHYYHARLTTQSTRPNQREVEAI